jgi:6-phosphogluconate dehydrogenase
MQLGMVGLGRMGANMVRRLMKSGHQCVVYDRSEQAVADLMNFQDKLLSALRFQFGGHLEKAAGK